jgi:hypothetical protein
MKKIRFLFAISWTLITLGAFAMFGFGDDDKENTAVDVTYKTAEECEVPDYAKLIGHEELWLKHNDCQPMPIDKNEKPDED